MSQQIEQDKHFLNINTEHSSLILLQCMVNERAIPIYSNLGNRIICRMPRPERNRRITFRWEHIMEEVLRMTNLFKELFLKVFRRSFVESISLWCHTMQPYSMTEHMTDLQKHSKSADGSPERFSIFRKYNLDATFAHRTSTCAQHPNVGHHINSKQFKTFNCIDYVTTDTHRCWMIFVKVTKKHLFSFFEN